MARSTSGNPARLGSRKAPEQGLRGTDDATFVSAMSRINMAIQNPVFALSFVGAFLALAGAAIYSWATGLAGALPVSIALACYTATLVITVGVNIPLNNRLGSAASAQHAGAGREFFEHRWTRGTFTARGCHWQPWLPSALRGPCFDRL